MLRLAPFPFTSPLSVAFNEDGSLSYVTDDGGFSGPRRVYAIDTATNTVTGLVINNTPFPFVALESLAFKLPSVIPPRLRINTAGLKGNNLSLANYLNANAPSSVVGLFAPLHGSALTSALQSAAPTRNAIAYFHGSDRSALPHSTHERKPAAKAVSDANLQQEAGRRNTPRKIRSIRTNF